MIFDLLENWKIYPYGKAWETAFAFLTTLSPDAEEKRYELQGDDMYAMVQQYETRSLEEAKLEAHRQYVDIQMALMGSERMDWFPANKSQNNTEYDAAKDVQFYNRPTAAPVSLTVSPHTFAVFFPNDAHMPQLSVGPSPTRVKKVVVKINKKLLPIP
ncbi:MAG: YhcH/YjgK/YiaL family protein [bacterium]|jgi:YhcH/YjgK/YiaL family protein|nr:YhcH/YjgK/YiaL family protein [bacterium]